MRRIFVVIFVVFVVMGFFSSSIYGFKLEECLEKNLRSKEDCECSDECGKNREECYTNSLGAKINVRRSCILAEPGCHYSCLRRKDALWKGPLAEIDKRVALGVLGGLILERIPSEEKILQCSSQSQALKEQYHHMEKSGCIGQQTDICADMGVEILIRVSDLRSCIALYYPTFEN